MYSRWLNFTPLLSWCLILYHSGGSSKAKDGLPEDCKLACGLAISQLEAVSEHLREAEITVAELEKINENMEQMERLCEAAHGQAHQLKQSILYTCAQLRLEEFQAFQEQVGHLKNVCQHLYDHEVIGKRFVILVCKIFYLHIIKE